MIIVNYLEFDIIDTWTFLNNSITRWVPRTLDDINIFVIKPGNVINFDVEFIY